MVLDLSRDRVLTVTGRETGLMQISADAVILAMGCRERPRGALNIPGAVRRAFTPPVPPSGW